MSSNKQDIIKNKKIPVMTYEETQRQNVLVTLNILLHDMELNVLVVKRAIKAIENRLDFFETVFREN